MILHGEAMEIDVRWHQRLDNFNKVLQQLTDGVALSRQRALSTFVFGCKVLYYSDGRIGHFYVR